MEGSRPRFFYLAVLSVTDLYRESLPDSARTGSTRTGPVTNLPKEFERLDTYWADILYFIGEGRPEAYHALMKMPAPDFYRLLEAQRRNYKPAT